MEDDWKIMRLPAVEDATGLKKTMLYELISRQEFPAPVVITGRARGWRKGDVRARAERRAKSATQ